MRLSEAAQARRKIRSTSGTTGKINKWVLTTRFLLLKPAFLNFTIDGKFKPVLRLFVTL
jgi:hypothetical protein